MVKQSVCLSVCVSIFVGALPWTVTTKPEPTPNLTSKPTFDLQTGLWSCEDQPLCSRFFLPKNVLAVQVKCVFWSPYTRVRACTHTHKWGQKNSPKIRRKHCLASVLVSVASRVRLWSGTSHRVRHRSFRQTEKGSEVCVRAFTGFQLSLLII